MNCFGRNVQAVVFGEVLKKWVESGFNWAINSPMVGYGCWRYAKALT